MRPVLITLLSVAVLLSVGCPNDEPNEATTSRVIQDICNPPVGSPGPTFPCDPCSFDSTPPCTRDNSDIFEEAIRTVSARAIELFPNESRLQSINDTEARLLFESALEQLQRAANIQDLTEGNLRQMTAELEATQQAIDDTPTGDLENSPSCVLSCHLEADDYNFECRGGDDGFWSRLGCGFLSSALQIVCTADCLYPS